MYKVSAPNKEYNGISAGVHFINGVAITDKCIDWFKSKGYKVEKIKDSKDNKDTKGKDNKDTEGIEDTKDNKDGKDE